MRQSIIIILNGLVRKTQTHISSVLMLVSLCAGCCREPIIKPYMAQYNLFSPATVPMIIAGTALEDAEPIDSIVRNSDNQPVRLHKVRVTVEHVFSGTSSDKTLDIFYFKFLGSYGGSASPLNIKKSTSAIFFLQPDGQKWRSVCDGWNTCIIDVRTGTHRNYVTAGRMTFEQEFVNFTMSRGDTTTDEQMIAIIQHPPLRWGTEYVLKRIRQLASEDPSPKVREVAQQKAEQMQSKSGVIKKQQP